MNARTHLCPTNVPADALGVRWAKRTAEQLRAEGRSPAGGWPGTLSEAMSLVHAELGVGPGEHRAALARAAYAAARKTWSELAEPELDD